jgi:hypothetical protein
MPHHRMRRGAAPTPDVAGVDRHSRAAACPTDWSGQGTRDDIHIDRRAMRREPLPFLRKKFAKSRGRGGRASAGRVAMWQKTNGECPWRRCRSGRSRAILLQ